MSGGMITTDTSGLADKVITNEGDIVIGNALGNRSRLGIGTNLQQLQSDGSQLSWQTISAGATLTDNSITGATNNQTTTSTSDINMTGTSSATLATVTGGKAYCTLFANSENNTANSVNYVSLWDGTSSGLVGLQRRENTAGAYHTDTCALVHDLDGTVIQMRWHVNQGTANLFNSTLAGSKTAILEIS